MKLLIRHGKCISCDYTLQAVMGHRQVSILLPAREMPGCRQSLGTHGTPECVPVTAQMSYGVMTTVPFPSPGVSRLGIPLAPSQDVLNTSFWVSHPSGKMVSPTPEQAPGCVCPPRCCSHVLPNSASTTHRSRQPKPPAPDGREVTPRAASHHEMNI